MFRKLFVPTFIALVAFLMLSFCVGTLDAATIVKANNTTNLATGTSWVGGVAPGAADVAQWDSTVTGSNTTTLGSSLYFSEIKILNPSAPVTINNDGNTLGLTAVGGTGIDMSSATQNLTLNCPVALDSTAGRGRSVGKSSNAGAPASSRFQYSMSPSRLCSRTFFNSAAVSFTHGSSRIFSCAPCTAVMLTP